MLTWSMLVGQKIRVMELQHSSAVQNGLCALSFASMSVGHKEDSEDSKISKAVC